MTKLTTLDLSPFYRQAVGFDRLFDRIINNIEHAGSTTNYPPYNIIETGDNTWAVEVAVAGFGEGDINVQIKDGDLIITGEKNSDLPEGHVYRHQGISARKFIRTFSLGEYMEVRSATVKDGILTVACVREIPEAAKPKTIAITYTN